MSYVSDAGVDIFGVFPNVPSGYFWGGMSKLLVGAVDAVSDVVVTMPGVAGSFECVGVFADLSGALIALRAASVDVLGTSIAMLRTVVAYESGAVLTLSGVSSDTFVASERPFDMSRSPRFWRHAVVAANCDALSYNTHVGEECQCVAVATLLNLCLRRYRVSAASVADGWSPTCVYAYVSRLSESVGGEVFTHMSSSFDADLVLRLLDLGYAIVVSLGVGTLLPRCGTERLACGIFVPDVAFENEVSHCVVLVRDHLGAVLLVDETGVRIVGEDSVRALANPSDDDGGRFGPWHDGCLIVGVRVRE